MKNYEYTRFNAFDGSNEKEEEKRFTDKRIVELIEKLKTEFKDAIKQQQKLLEIYK